MKKIIAGIFLLMCALVLFLATVDLTPYLAPDRLEEQNKALAQAPDKTAGPAQTPEVIDQAKAQPVKTTEPKQVQTETDSVAPKAEEPATSDEPVVIADQIDTVPAQTDNLPAEKEKQVSAAGEQPKEIPSSLIELEVMMLPVAEYPFSILLETFAEQATAELAIPYYQQRGITAHWVKVNLGAEGIRYRLFTGEFATVSEAQAYLDQEKLVDKPIKATYFSARVGVYRDKAQLAEAFVKTRETGVIPYILGTKEGDYFLYVGAFYTFIGATAQCRDLTESGLTCKPVKRSTIRPE